MSVLNSWRSFVKDKHPLLFLIKSCHCGCRVPLILNSNCNYCRYALLQIYLKGLFMDNHYLCMDSGLDMIARRILNKFGFVVLFLGATNSPWYNSYYCSNFNCNTNRTNDIITPSIRHPVYRFVLFCHHRVWCTPG